MLWLEIPAYAGSTRTSATPTGTAPDHPRIRGEHYAAHKVAIEAGGSSPHTRGAPTAPVVRVAELGIIPAYAGSTGTRRRTDRSGRDHPRIRGEHVIGALCYARAARIIPAYAGSTRRCCTGTDATKDHPRIRGEHSLPTTSRRNAPGSSPHTRGALGDPADDLGDAGIIPAYAGSTGVSSSSATQTGDHPRIRGEHIVNGL